MESFQGNVKWPNTWDYLNISITINFELVHTESGVDNDMIGIKNLKAMIRK